MLYNEYVDLLFSYGSKITDDEDILKDSIQQLFLELYLSGKKLANPDNLKFYLLKALKIIIINEIRKSKKYSTLEIVTSMSFKLELDPENEWINSEEKQQKIEVLQKKLTKLTPEKRELLFLKFYSGLNNQEIGLFLGLKPETVKKRIYRLIKQFQVDFQKITFNMLSLFYNK